MKARFRIRPEYLADMVACLRDAGIEPLRIYGRSDDAIAVEIGDLTDSQGSVLMASFKPEWSAIMGIVGDPLFETKH